MISKGMLSIAKAAVDKEPAIFVFSVSRPLHAHEGGWIQKNWAETWTKAGVLNIPTLIILADGATITSLTEDALRDLGLMRVPSAPEAV